MATETLIYLPRRVCVECLSHVSRLNQWVNKETSKFFRGKGWLCKDCYEILKPKIQKPRTKFTKSPNCLYCGQILSSRKSNLYFCNKICQKKFKILK